jgi:hypothetical protein
MIIEQLDPNEEEIESGQIEDEEGQVNSTGVRNLSDIYKNLKQNMHEEERSGSDSGGSDSNPSDDDLNADEQEKLHENILEVIENFNNLYNYDDPNKNKKKAMKKYKTEDYTMKKPKRKKLIDLVPSAAAPTISSNIKDINVKNAP